MTHEQPEQPGAIRVLVVDDQRLMRDGIASLLGIQDGIEVVGTASNGQEALARAADLRPEVVLMDMRMPVMDGVSATAHLREAHNAFMTLPPYTRTREVEAPRLGRGPTPCRLSL
jgi:DNA-binding NarL/FixJ family response regulator